MNTVRILCYKYKGGHKIFDTNFQDFGGISPLKLDEIK